MLGEIFGEANAEINDQIYKMESDHLRKKTIIINIILISFVVPLTLVLYAFDIDFLNIFVYLLTFAFIITVNMIFYYYRRLLTNIRLSMYITSIGMYIMTTALILDVRTPSIFTMLFLTYATLSLYQDYKVSIFNSFLLFSSGLFITSQFPDVFESGTALSPSIFYIVVFLLLFIALLSVSSAIIIKRKNHVYKQVVDVKEREFKYIETIFELQEKYSEKEFDYKEYYQKLEEFTDALSNTIGMSNVFAERISILKDMTKLKDKTLSKKYKGYNHADFSELKQLELRKYKKIPYLALESAQIDDIQPEEKELIFERRSPTFNDREDDIQVKIVAFSVFYVLLRTGNIHIKPLSHEQIFEVIGRPEFSSVVDSDIYNVLIEKRSELEKELKKIDEGSASS